MKIKSYLELKKENKQLQQQLKEMKELYKKRLDDEEYITIIRFMEQIKKFKEL